MGKRLALEAIQSAPFRWPKDNDRLLKPSEDGGGNAVLAHRAEQRMALMASGYEMSASTLVDQALENSSLLDFLVYPIVFNYRHFIELRLKGIIADFGLSVGVEPIWSSHSLSVLWNAFAQVLDGYGTPDPDEADEVVAGLIQEFSKIDPGSFSFRYPCDTHGESLVLPFKEVDLNWLKDVMKGVSNYFDGTEGFLAEVSSA